MTVHHWTDRLFSFTTTRDPSLRFSNGHFSMIGLRVDSKPLLRAYSIVSANYEERLEFLSIKVPDGPLTSRLKHIQHGDKIIVGRKPTGTLLIDYLLPGKRLYLLGSGTGLAPFLSVARDPDTYERFEKVILVHGVRQVAELCYHNYLTQALPKHEALGEYVTNQMLYYPTVTREAFAHQGRITTVVDDGKMTRDIGLPELDSAHDRIMICGSPGLNKDMRAILEAKGFREGNTRLRVTMWRSERLGTRELKILFGTQSRSATRRVSALARTPQQSRTVPASLFKSVSDADFPEIHRAFADRTASFGSLARVTCFVAN